METTIEVFFIQKKTIMRFHKRLSVFLFKVIDKLFRIFAVNAKSITIDNVSCKKYLIFPSEKFIMPKITDILGNEQLFFEGHEACVPYFYIRELPNAYAFINREEVWTENKELILDHTTQKRNPMRSQFFINFKCAQKIKGCVAHLSLSGLEDNYYHWLTECLSRLYLLKNADIKPDYYIVNNALPFQKQWLELLGINQKKIISSQSDENGLIQPDSLVITTFINNSIPIKYSPDRISYYKMWLPSWIGEQYKEIAENIKVEPQNNIYITRKNACYRKIINENELIPILDEYNFQIVDLDRLTVIEQIKVFRSAKVVVGIHGAGLVNMFFAGKTCRILEIYPKNYYDPSFRLQAKTLGLDYHYLIGDEIRQEVKQNINPQRRNIKIDKNTFRNALSKL